MLKIQLLLLLLYFIGYITSATVCPDGNECRGGESCCTLYSGSYGCCPVPKATCCSDEKHCCPYGYICHVESSSCRHGNKQVDMFLSRPTIKVERLASKLSTPFQQANNELNLISVANIMCPDRYSQCPTGTTCCLLMTGRYGCCRYPQAVCCADRVHCCPNNFVCNMPYCSPRRQFEVRPMKKLKRHVMVSSYVVDLFTRCPDGKTSCGNGRKCCPAKALSGRSCCTYRNGVCCSDGRHCCPKGFTCNLEKKTCTKKNKRIPMKIKTKAESRKLHDFAHLKKRKEQTEVKLSKITCPDNVTQCDDSNKCCNNIGKLYICCKFSKGVCCKGSSYCCPQGYTCAGAGICNKGFNVLCPDGVSHCGDNQTCCKLPNGAYGCCPLINATCCDDNQHCCPTGFKCDGKGYCIKAEKKILATKHIKAIKKFQNRICPDDVSVCPSYSTCCNISSGGYGCCPLPNAVCCSDMKFCCPKGFTCDGNGSCTKGGKTILATKHINAIKKFKKVMKKICPDLITACPSGYTCCKLSTGGYGCCPLPNAVCCTKYDGCCPYGYTCAAGGYCTKKGEKTILASKHIDGIKKLNKITCPDDISSCPDGDTCCKLSTGGYGCCPLPHAVCCTKYEGCCPNGYVCDAGGYCTKGNDIILASKHTKAIRNFRLVTCPDKRAKCPESNTCCRNVYGGYGCCPLLKATCCSDKLHCCPHGFRCAPGGKCTMGNELIPASTHTKAINLITPNIICPDGVSKCYFHQTCCELPDGHYGCCPLRNAVCCSDHEHCCPQGYTCSGVYCENGSKWIIASKHINAIQIVTIPTTLICPDKKTSCPDGNTCCKTPLGYGCCPLAYGVCCSDQLHCCPEGYKCGPGGLCGRGSEKFLQAKNIVGANKKVENILCPDGISECDDGSTCCELVSGEYGCCRLPNAVCCADHKHCCPNGYKCDAKGKCTSGTLRIPATKTTSPKKRGKKPSDVLCPGGVTVCDGGTCCRGNGNYNCCPLEDAVCCKDHRHCCPKSFRCIGGGRCTKGDITIAASKRDQVISKSKINNGFHQCPDQHSYCMEGFTCCRLATTGYGCCPLPNAVCCKDEKYCCPHGSKCIDGGKCTKGDITIAASKRDQAISKINNGFHQCPDQHSYCMEGFTCCRLATTGYGCCPLPNAVCCKDEKYCCPHGAKCTEGGKCEQEDQIIDASEKSPASTLAVISKASSNSMSSRDKLLLKILRGELQTCADGVKKCKQYETCCPTSRGFTCCPIVNAVCCGGVCCHNDAVCTRKGICKKAPRKSAPNEYIKFEPIEPVEDYVTL